jgi:hypothetical protein
LPRPATGILVHSIVEGLGQLKMIAPLNAELLLP